MEAGTCVQPLLEHELTLVGADELAHSCTGTR